VGASNVTYIPGCADSGPPGAGCDDLATVVALAQEVRAPSPPPPLLK